MNSQRIVGIDVGGTKIHAGLVQDGKVMEEVRFPTSAQAPMEQILTEIVNGIKPLIGPEVAGIGIGVPGLVDEEKGTVFDVQNIHSFTSVPLKKHLEDYFRKTVYITNDANTFVVGEKYYGKAKAFKNVVGLSLGTGLGGGIILKDSLYSGSFSSAGELGGIPYLDQTLEDYCSGKFFRKQLGKEGAEVYALAEAGEAEALDAFAQFGIHIGNAIKVVLFTLSPEAIVFGGSVSRCYPYFKEAMEKEIQTFPFKRVRQQLVVYKSEMENAAVLGAAALFQMRNKEAKTLLTV